jgi:hypothetical protein
MNGTRKKESRIPLILPYERYKKKESRIPLILPFKERKNGG